MVAEALRTVGLGCCAVGEAGCPERQAVDEVVVDWCRRRGAVLVTADRSRKRPEMRVALARHGVCAVYLDRSPRAVPLLRALLMAWEQMQETFADATRAQRPAIVRLDLRTGRPGRARHPAARR